MVGIIAVGHLLRNRMIEITKKRNSFCLLGRRYIYKIPFLPDDDLLNSLEGMAKKKELKLGAYRMWFFENEYFILELAISQRQIDGKFRRTVWEKGVDKLEKFLCKFYDAEIKEI